MDKCGSSGSGAGGPGPEEPMIVDLTEPDDRDTDSLEMGGNKEVLDCDNSTHEDVGGQGEGASSEGQGHGQDDDAGTVAIDCLKIPGKVMDQVEVAYQQSKAAYSNFFETLRASFLPALYEDIGHDMESLLEVRDEMTTIARLTETRLAGLRGLMTHFSSALDGFEAGSANAVGAVCSAAVESSNCQDDTQMGQENIDHCTSSSVPEIAQPEVGPDMMKKLPEVPQ